MFCNNKVLLYQGSLSYTCCYYWGNQNSLLYQGLHYIEVHYIEVPLYNKTSLCEQILPVPWLFVISRFHCICLKGHQNNYFSRRIRARVSIQAAKLRCCGENYTVLRQNGLFECNQKILFEELEGNEKSSDVTPVEEKCQNIWGGIWEEKVKHNA